MSASQSSMTELEVVVTGGAGGLGRSVVAKLVSAGARCHVPLYEGETADSLGHHGDRVATYSGIDLSNEASCQQFFAAVPGLWASVHLAGGFAMSPLAETTLEDFEKMHRRNAVSCFLSVREAQARMPGAGRIVNVAARPVVQPVGQMVAYSASKASVAAITQSAAAELKERGILVNAVLPSIIDTEANRQAMPDADHASWPKPAEIADVIRFLVSPENRLVSGSLVPVYGRA